MTTASTIITSALREIAVIGDSDTPNASVSNYALGVMNNWLNALNARGCVFPTVTLTISDTVPLPSELDNALSLIVAREISGRYGKELTGLQVARMNQAEHQIVAAHFHVGNTSADGGLLSMPGQSRQTMA